TLA
ncbi:hypothetical protein CFC21_023159, partial [Triticum aestivum]